jgi:hypothetical protein
MMRTGLQDVFDFHKEMMCGYCGRAIGLTDSSMRDEQGQVYHDSCFEIMKENMKRKYR